MKCISHSQKINQWVLLENRKMMKVLVVATGLYPLISTSYKYVNKVVVFALVEK